MSEVETRVVTGSPGWEKRAEELWLERQKRRDMFAAAALQGLFAIVPTWQDKSIVDRSIEIADLMITKLDECYQRKEKT
jgi:hypothetical protein